MTRKKWCLIGAAVLGLGVAGIATSINPIAERYVAPMVQEQLHNTVRGTIQYDSMHIAWNGDVVLQNVSLRDENDHLVAAVPTMNVSMKWTSAPSILMGNSSGAAIVSTITLEKPDVHVWQLADGSWNVNSLLESSSKNDKKSFDGNIVINDATGAVRFKDGNVHRLSNLDGNIALNVDGMTKGALNGLLDDHSIAVNGSIDMNKMDDFDLFVRAESVDISGIMNMVPSNKNFSITSGILHDVKAQITGRDGKYSMSGNLAFDGVGGTYKNGSTTYQIGQGNGKIFFQNNTVLITHSGWYVNDQAVKVNGLVTLGDEVGLNLNAVADSVALEAFTKNQITGNVGARVHIGGTSVNPYVSGSIKSDAISYDSYHIDSGEANFSYSDGTVDIHDASLYIGNGSVKAKGQYGIDSGEFSIGGTIHNAEIAPFTQNLSTPASGIVNGEFSVKGKNSDITSIEGNIVGTSLSVRGISIDSARVSFNNVGALTNIAVTGAIGNGQLSGYGTIDNNLLNLSLSADSLDASNFSSLVGNSVSGNITGHASITGNLDNPSVTGSVTSPEIVYSGAHFNSINAGFTIKNHILELTNTSIGDGDGAITVGGTFDLNSNALNMRARAKAVRIENLIRPFSDVPLTGWFESENEIRGTLDNPYVQGHVHLYDGSYNGKLISDAKADYTLENKTLTLPKFTIQGYGAVIQGAGTMSEDALNIDLEGKDIDIGRLLVNTDYDVKGYVQAKGHIGGSLYNPNFNGSVTSNFLTINGEGITNISGTLYADKTVVNLEKFEFDEEQGGHYMARAGMSTVGDKRLFGTLQVTNGRVSNLLSLLGKPVDKLDGSLSGTVDLGGTYGNPSLNVVGSIKDVTIDTKVVGDAKIDASLENRKFKIRTLKLPVDDGLIAAGGTVDLDGDADLQIAVRDVDIEPFLPLIGDNINATGSITGVINMTGATQNPKVELSASLANGSYNGIDIDQGFVLATMENHVINVQRIQGVKEDYKLSAYGKIPLAALYTTGYLDANDSKAMDMTIDFNEADMAVIPLITPTVKESRISAGKGTAGLAAKVNWTGHTMTSYRAAIQLDGLDLANEYISGPLKGELYIAEKEGIPTLMGNLNLENMKFKIPLSLETSESTRDLGIDVNVHAGKNVRLYDRTLYNMRISGDVHFGGSVFNPTSSGQFNVVSGTFKYLSHTFDITKGTATFTSGTYLPMLQLDAETNVGTYNIYLGVKGTVDHMDLTLKSEPSLSRKQIISMLTFGRGEPSNSSTITNEDANALAVAGVQMFAFGYVQDAVQNALGLDRVNITTGSIDPNEPTSRETSGNYNIEIGKYVLPRTMITYTQGINNKQNKYGIEYSLRRNVKFNAWHTSQGSTYIGGRWTREF
ncbi:MAG: translocation/assembly module TamB domain-containing protein [Veillonella sp.]|nr:translocation/assembly module TamB domain-containing protein [Veillonella sp.]